MRGEINWSKTGSRRNAKDKRPCSSRLVSGLVVWVRSQVIKVGRKSLSLRSSSFPPCLANIIASVRIRSDGWVSIVLFPSRIRAPRSRIFTRDFFFVACFPALSAPIYKSYSNLNENVGDNSENKQLLGLNKVTPWRRHRQLQHEAVPETEILLS